ncbi:MAG: hypothetical protein K2W85_04155 [Phycisphaerales bacterium]|nr:hypothetical protein [Phycisphaerales bacterium]
MNDHDPNIPPEHIAVIAAAVVAMLGEHARIAAIRPAIISRPMSLWMRSARERAPHRTAPNVATRGTRSSRSNPRPKPPRSEYP